MKPTLNVYRRGLFLLLTRPTAPGKDPDILAMTPWSKKGGREMKRIAREYPGFRVKWRV